MKRFCTIFTLLTLYSTSSIGQISDTPQSCSHEHTMQRMFDENPNADLEQNANELFIQAFIENMIATGESKSHDSTAQYIIPVVLHVFHNGEDGQIDLEQAQSGLDVLNADIKGLNDDWDDINPEFDGIKGALDIQFCLASIDPDGNSTTGVLYYDDSLSMLNETDLTDHAWNNFKYFNIYLPKYAYGDITDFTAYASYPSITRVEANTDGVVYSSIRWGYGTLSELDEGQEWASVITHEVGHWLNLRHTFENGCSFPGDLVDDTPPTLGGVIELADCDNNNGSCGENTNGENYMDYNHDCKKMFTQGQVDRMTAALYLESRINLWSTSNLYETGCKIGFTNLPENKNHLLTLYPNPANDIIHFIVDKNPQQISVYNSIGTLIITKPLQQNSFDLAIEFLAPGVYIYQLDFENSSEKGKFIVQ